ncbi:hypothetical protein OSG_eHP27_00075 [environmental Halophage eHP-27]|nr:hypothetical protein OSG_eHP27_00075 [environmental Halophage eHP-27]
MPEYTPPADDGVDFALESYTPPAEDAVDFEFIQALTLSPQATTLEFQTPTATVENVAALTLSPQPTAIEFTPQTAQIGTESWSIDGVGIGANQSERVTPTTITLTQRVTTDRLENALRPLKSDEGKVNTLAQDDGGFVAVDRANGGNTFRLVPPVSRTPLRENTDVHVRRYEEDLVSQDLGEWTVGLELTRDATRDDTTSASDTAASDEWGLTTRYGTLATSRVDAEFLGTGEDGVEQFELTARLTFDQAHVFETALNRLGGGRVRGIPDETNVAVDDTTDDAATLTVDAPDGQTVVDDGDYLVREWESTEINTAFQSVTVTIAAKF